MSINSCDKMLKKIKQSIRFLLGTKNETDFYSQGGEDAIVMKTFLYLLDIKKGFYLDIGAFHPYKHSNTYLLYKAGWSGINIDPRPGFKALFDKHKPRDINIEAGIGEKNSAMTYYIVGKDSTMNTFSRTNLERLNLLGQVQSTIDVMVYKLSFLLESYPAVKEIDYLNIDAEGFELQVLSGLDFTIHPPKVISIEQNDVLTFSDVLNSEVNGFLASKSYVAYAKNILLKNVSTVFYIRKDLL